MTDPIDTFLRQVDDRLTLDPGERQQVLGELRSHLEETADARAAADPSATRAEVREAVVRDFGSPDDLALAYNPAGSVVLTDASGATVMTFSAAVTKAGKVAGEVAKTSARAVGRGAGLLAGGVGRSLKVLFLGLVILLGVALLSASVVAVFLFDDIKELVEERVEQDVYRSYAQCGDIGCNGTRGQNSFYLPEGANALRYGFNIHHADDHPVGRIEIRLTDPTGNVVLNRTFDNGTEHRTWDRGTLAPVPGYWEVHVRFHSYHGWFDLNVDATGI